MKICFSPYQRRCAALTAALFCGLGVTPLSLAAQATPVTESEAIEAALSRHPELSAFATDLKAAEGRALQAALRPNPELEIETENLTDSLTVGVSQVLELGGKRQARIQRAEAEFPVLRDDLKRLRLDLAAGARRAFVALLAAQERVGLRREALDLARRLAETVAEKVKAGAVSPIEETRARVAMATAKAEMGRADREEKEARFALGAAMGDSAPSFSEASGSLRSDLTIPEWAEMAARVAANPDLTRWTRERTSREAALLLESRLAVQDLSLKGGVTFSRPDSAGTLTVGLSIPLPFHDKNQGAIRQAEALLAKTTAESRAAENKARSELAQRYEALSESVREAKLLREDALSGAQQAYDAVSEGYRLGKFKYLDVLDAGGALLEVKVRHLEALEALHLARVDLDRLIGEPSLPASEPAKN